MSEQPTKSGRRIPAKSLLVLVLIMAMEAGIFALWATFTGPSPAAASMGQLPVKPVQTSSEVRIMDLRAPNTRTGKLWMYQIEVVVECPKAKAATVEDARKARDAAIRDALSTIVRKADPQHFQEPDLQTLRRQFQAALTEILGEDLIERVLIPRCEPYPV